jgi:hypothetical protein
MNYWRCVCGERDCWESGMPPAACVVCDKCGSTLATSPSTHREPENHRPDGGRLEVKDQTCCRVTRCEACRKELGRVVVFTDRPAEPLA